MVITTTAVIAISINPTTTTTTTTTRWLRHTIVHQRVTGAIVIIIGGRPRFILRNELAWQSLSFCLHLLPMNKHEYSPRYDTESAPVRIVCVCVYVWVCVRACALISGPFLPCIRSFLSFFFFA